LYRLPLAEIGGTGNQRGGIQAPKKKTMLRIG